MTFNETFCEFIEYILSSEKAELYHFGKNTSTVLYGDSLMLSKTVDTNFVFTRSAWTIGYFLSTLKVLILIAGLEAASRNFLLSFICKYFEDYTKKNAKSL
jgi:hypothetical protein